MPKMTNIFDTKRRKNRGGVDASETRKQIDVSELLSRLGIEYKENGQELLAKCPNKNHEDNNPSWSIHNELGDNSNGLFYCYSCKWSGDVFKLIMEVLGCSFSESLKFVQGKDFGKSDDIESSVNVNTENYRTYWPKPIQIPKGVVEVEYESKCFQYLFSRGIYWDDIQRFGLMDWTWKRRVFVPLHFRGYLISWLARSYNGDDRKVLNMPGRNGIKWAFFGTNFLKKENTTIYLTEGWVDAIRLHQAGFQNVVAVCGSVLSEEKIKQLTWVRDVIYWADGDNPGRKFATEVKNWFSAFADVVVVECDEGKDPADYSIDELTKKLTREKSKWQ